jgi:hypothetical protein
MRVIESPLDGSLIQAATDEELEKALIAHYEEEGEDISDDDAHKLVEEQAYDATDS